MFTSMSILFFNKSRTAYGFFGCFERHTFERIYWSLTWKKNVSIGFKQRYMVKAFRFILDPSILKNTRFNTQLRIFLNIFCIAVDKQKKKFHKA